VKAFPLRFIAGYGHICVLLFFALSGDPYSRDAAAEEISPPTFLSAIGDQEGKVPLFWFCPHPDTHLLADHQEQMSNLIHVVLPWRDNCVAVRMISPEIPFHLLKSRIYISHQGAIGDTDYDFCAPFFVTVNRDSAGIPQNAHLDSVRCSAGEQDSLSPGEWVDLEHNLFMQDSAFWIVFHWEESSPLSPMLGEDGTDNVGSSFWGRRSFFHLEWHLTSHNLMIQAQIAANGNFISEVDSFNVYRSTDPESLICDRSRIAAVPGFQFGHADCQVTEDQTYFYGVTCLNSEGESWVSNLAQAVPKQAATLNATEEEFCVHTSAGQPVSRSLTLSNSGGLPLDFTVEVDMHPTDWMGGFDPSGYCWTDSRLDDDCEFHWVDVEDRGIRLGEDGDDNVDYGFFDLGFSFPLYGETFDSLRIASDGWISFSDVLPCYTDTFKCYINKTLPWLWGPYYLLAPFWEDLRVVDNSAIYSYSNSDSAVISFINLHRWSQAGGGPYSFQAILTQTGEIDFQYLRIPDLLYSATVGTQNRDGTVGLQVLRNEHLLQDSLAIKIKPGWIKVDSYKGWLQPGGNETLNLTFDPVCYPQGIYQADLLIHGWDKNHSLETKIIPLTFCIDTTTSVEWTDAQIPQAITLLQNYPNPFNPTTTIEFTLARPGPVRIEIFNILGQRVRTLTDGFLTAGYKTVIWDGRSDRGEEVSSGVYLCRIWNGEYSKTGKMLLLR
jgi:hypothetical protein